MRAIALLVVVLLVASPSVRAFDVLKFVYDSLVATDLWQTEQWYWATEDSPIWFEDYPVWEVNPLIAGRDWPHVEDYFQLSHAVPYLFEEPARTRFLFVGVLGQLWAVTRNNTFPGADRRYMLRYEFVF